MLVGLLVSSIVLLWPIAPGAGIAHDLWRSYRNDFVAMLPLPRGATEALLYVYCIAGTMGAWLVILGSVLMAVPKLAVVVLRPFADGFGRRQASAMVLTGLGAVVLCVGFAVRMLNDDTSQFGRSVNERSNYVESTSLPHR